jgi:hypothetical protein
MLGKFFLKKNERYLNYLNILGIFFTIDGKSFIKSEFFSSLDNLCKKEYCISNNINLKNRKQVV